MPHSGSRGVSLALIWPDAFGGRLVVLVGLRALWLGRTAGEASNPAPAAVISCAVSRRVVIQAACVSGAGKRLGRSGLISCPPTFPSTALTTSGTLTAGVPRRRQLDTVCGETLIRFANSPTPPASSMALSSPDGSLIVFPSNSKQTITKHYVYSTRCARGLTFCL